MREGLRSPYVQLAASAGEICDKIVEARERHGITYFTVFARRSEGFNEVVARLAD